ncbi:hypothetical protein TVAG_382040 [Trichomonas vaginalis G3]|uniref:Uncharacterized protein n=1 Tax=Trichomonas vaginalis (strain ATCC PRA-98 / G3) TaxID=412133 RepID=A2F2A7_TRIV3|nr:hypothetical protein TVAGG3_0496850 [Trichomonas vaginalis G3]EAY00986.1 hypothetical protein TVAG_382040 [Trichomonas vaginalis G3]KAI5516792.1 hypothetical protein TVAGG3_0496850 [Trichomonas vaginalis G3]|eukprot:XP_001330057.1 hypothetical protein [Trichomonas vaginalis G3]
MSTLEVRQSDPTNKSLLVTPDVLKYEAFIQKIHKIKSEQDNHIHPQELVKELNQFDIQIQQVKDLRKYNSDFIQKSCKFGLQRANDEYEHALEVIASKSNSMSTSSEPEQTEITEIV